VTVVALSGDQLSLSLVQGMVASINPCGFVLLPTYLMYFLGVQSADGTQRASMRRALVVSASVSAGFMLVFLVAGSIVHLSTTWIAENAKYATAVIGVALIVLGVAMLFGYRLPITTPRLDAGGRTRTVWSMFVYGIAYAIASISCTIGLFVASVFKSARRDGSLTGVANALAYGAGMALVVVALTVTLAFAKTGLVQFLRSKMQYVEMVAATFVVLSGIYLLVYFWVVDVNNDTNPITSKLEELQSWATGRIDDNWQLVAVVLLAVVAGAVILAMSRREREVPEEEREKTLVGR
jgi:cytochrome c biogenesis protein CcdA